MRSLVWITALLVGGTIGVSACATVGARPGADQQDAARHQAIADARLWTRSDLPSTNL